MLASASTTTPRTSASQAQLFTALRCSMFLCPLITILIMVSFFFVRVFSFALLTSPWPESSGLRCGRSTVHNSFHKDMSMTWVIQTWHIKATCINMQQIVKVFIAGITTVSCVDSFVFTIGWRSQSFVCWLCFQTWTWNSRSTSDETVSMCLPRKHDNHLKANSNNT